MAFPNFSGLRLDLAAQKERRRVLAIRTDVRYDTSIRKVSDRMRKICPTRAVPHFRESQSPAVGGLPYLLDRTDELI